MTIYVLLVFVALCVGMALSVSLFGTGGKRKNIFKDIYYSIEETKDHLGIYYTKSGDFSATMAIRNKVEQNSADKDAYYDYANLFVTLVPMLGEGYAIHKQDVFCRQSFDKDADNKNDFLSKSYFDFFRGRPYTEVTTYLTITQEVKKSAFFQYDKKKWTDFQVKLRKVQTYLTDNNVPARFLNKKEAQEFADRYFAVHFRKGVYSMSNYKADEEAIYMGDRKFKMYSLVDVDSVALPNMVRPYREAVINNTSVPEDFIASIASVPEADTVIYNQMIFIPSQKKELAALGKKKNRHSSMPDPSNQIAVEDITAVEDVISRESKMLVYTHYNLLVCVKKEIDFQIPTNYLENSLVKSGISMSRHAFNQMELYINSFPGNCFQMSTEYDRFLTLADAASCLLYKEHTKGDENATLKINYTNRAGVPINMDISGREGKTIYTDNTNFFCLGPSGTGKSFHMNSVVRQLYEQNTDVVMVDTGNSYEGLCQYFGGKYIAYTKEKPITMNPFLVREEELNDEKIRFLANLIAMIWKGAEGQITLIEQTILNRLIVEYYYNYFHGFTGFSDEQREMIMQELHREIRNEEDPLKDESRRKLRLQEIRVQKKRLIAMKDDLEEIEDEDERAVKKEYALRHVTHEDSDTIGLEDVHLSEEDIYDKEQQKRKDVLASKKMAFMEKRRLEISVTELSFNSFYDFAMMRLPDIIREENIEFDFYNFRSILKVFYKGGMYESTLNEQMGGSLLDERFIVFEIDAISENKTLFPIVTLIIMDVFLQKMRLKSNRKVLVIEEAWKALASPLMAEYIKYLFKTVRKFWGTIGVVTQDIQDIISSEIVKDAIISNADVTILLDQSKFKERYDQVKTLLSLTDVEVKKIFTINKLDNKEGRSRFNEVFIRRKNVSDVYGVEESNECYMTYTTERIEKEAIRLYQQWLGCSIQEALTAYCNDWRASGIGAPRSFAQKVHETGHVLRLHNREK